jgi:hypothetical protein
MKRNILYTFIITLLLTSCLMEQENPLIVATCTDGIRNQDETDIDCGGRCQQCEVKIPVVAPCATSLSKNIVSLDNSKITFTNATFSCSSYSRENFLIAYYANYREFKIELEGSIPDEDKIYSIGQYIDYDSDATVEYYDGWTYYVATTGELYVTIAENGDVNIEFCSVGLRENAFGYDDIITSGRVVCE